MNKRLAYTFMPVTLLAVLIGIVTNQPQAGSGEFDPGPFVAWAVGVPAGWAALLFLLTGVTDYVRGR